MSQVRYAFASGYVFKMALGLAAALAATFVMLAATSSPSAQANPPSGCAPGVVVVCNNNITVIGGSVNVLTENKILNNSQITIVKDVLNAKCGGVINVSCIDLSLKDIKLLITDPKVIGIVKL
jgi:hypothetical protein